MNIESIKPSEKGLEVFWDDSQKSCFPWFWLRDHSERRTYTQLLTFLIS